jgi:hypothetical protein
MPVQVLRERARGNCTVQLIRDESIKRSYVRVECRRQFKDHVDFPIMYDSTGFIAYDFPERVPQYIRPVVKRFLLLAKQENKRFELLAKLSA